VPDVQPWVASATAWPARPKVSEVEPVHSATA
jgi:hypothetical protein